MSFRILFVTSTIAEARVLEKLRGFRKGDGTYMSDNVEIRVLISGVGCIPTVWAVKHWIARNRRPDLVINAGIAGSFNSEIGIGSVVMPVADCFADSGIEDGDNFLTLSEAGLAGADEFPFINGYLHADSGYVKKFEKVLTPVTAITVNTASGSVPTIDKLLRKYNPDIETMEGAAFFYICIREYLPFLAVRAVSNIVEPRNKENWDITLALANLSEKLNEIILTF